MDLEFVIAIRGNHKGPNSHGEQFVLPHDPHDPFVIHRHASPPQFCCNTAVTVAPTMFDSNLLNRRSHFHFLFDRVLLPKRTVEACPAHSRQLTHALDTQAALQCPHFSHLVVDAIPPVPPFFWRRAPTFARHRSKNPPPPPSRLPFASTDGFAYGRT